MKKKLSIVIPTYNRKERLLLQLSSILCQEESNFVNIIVLDNASNYDVESEIRCSLSKFNIDNLTYVRNKVNVGMGANLALILLQSDSEWIWTLSDDDITTDNSIATVLADIEKYPDTDMFKYSINIFEPHKDIVIHDIDNLTHYYLRMHHAPGDFVFISNCVYNKRCIDSFFGNSLTESYTLVSHILPIVRALDEGIGILRFRPHRIVNFVPAAPNTGWGMFYGALGVSTVSCLQLKCTRKQINNLTQVVMSGFSHYWLIQKALSLKNRRQAHFLYKQIYSRSYKYSSHIIDKVWYMLFHIFYVTHIDPIFIDVIRKRIRR